MPTDKRRIQAGSLLVLPLAVIEVIGTMETHHMLRGMGLAVVAAAAAGVAALGGERVKRIVPSIALVFVLALTPQLSSVALSWAAALSGTAALVAFLLDTEFTPRSDLAWVILGPIAIVAATGLFLSDVVDARSPVVLFLLATLLFVPAAIAFALRSRGVAQ